MHLSVDQTCFFRSLLSTVYMYGCAHTHSFPTFSPVKACDADEVQVCRHLRRRRPFVVRDDIFLHKNH